MRDKISETINTQSVLERDCYMNMKELIKELRIDSGMNMKDFSTYFRIPYRTYQDWEYGKREMPEYLLRLMAYKLKMEGIVQSIPEELSDNE